MVEAEEEYVEQLEILISCFLRPFKMAASSKNPPCTHEDINSIFLNSETVLFLHQIFLKGLTARMESWPTLVLGTSLGGATQSGEGGEPATEWAAFFGHFPICPSFTLIFFSPSRLLRLSPVDLMNLSRLALME